MRGGSRRKVLDNYTNLFRKCTKNKCRGETVKFGFEHNWMENPGGKKTIYINKLNNKNYMNIYWAFSMGQELFYVPYICELI